MHKGGEVELFAVEPSEGSQTLEGTTWPLTLFESGGDGVRSGGVLASPQTYWSDSNEHGDEEIGASRAEVAGHRLWGEDDPLHRTKNNERRVIPMHQALYHELRQLPRRLPAVCVFCRENGKLWEHSMPDRPHLFSLVIPACCYC